MATANFKERLSVMKEPMTFNEIESMCETLNFRDSLKELLEEAESNGDIVSKSFSSSNDASLSADDSLVIYFMKDCDPKTEKTINISAPTFRHSHSRLNLPFRSPTVIRSGTTMMCSPAGRLPAIRQPARLASQDCMKKTLHAKSKNQFTNPLTPTSSHEIIIDSSFKRPLVSSITTANKSSIDELEAELFKLNKDISLLSEAHSEEDLELHIKALHEYNEIKDVGQLLLGKLAESLGMTTVDMYDRFSLNVDD